MNVSSLSPWLLDFHTVQFSVSSGCFLLKIVIVLLFVVQGGTVCLPTPPSWPEVLIVVILERHQVECFQQQTANASSVMT